MPSPQQKLSTLIVYLLGGFALAQLLGAVLGKILIFSIERTEAKRDDGVVYASDALFYTASTTHPITPKIEATRIYKDDVISLNGNSKTLSSELVSETGKASWYEITGYCLNKNPMASGKAVYSGAVACPSNLKLDTKVKIGEKEYVCEDRMAKKYRNGNYIDVWYENCQDALNWGRRKVEVYIVS